MRCQKCAQHPPANCVDSDAASRSTLHAQGRFDTRFDMDGLDGQERALLAVSEQTDERAMSYTWRHNLGGAAAFLRGLVSIARVGKSGTNVVGR